MHIYNPSSREKGDTGLLEFVGFQPSLEKVSPGSRPHPVLKESDRYRKAFNTCFYVHTHLHTLRDLHYIIYIYIIFMYKYIKFK